MDIDGYKLTIGVFHLSPWFMSFSFVLINAILRCPGEGGRNRVYTLGSDSYTS